MRSLRGVLIQYDCVLKKKKKKKKGEVFPGGAVVKNPPANAGDMGSSPGREDPTCCGAAKPANHNN